MKTLIKLFVIVVVSVHLGGMAVDSAMASADAVGVDLTDVLTGLAGKLWWLGAIAAGSVVFTLFSDTKEA